MCAAALLLLVGGAARADDADPVPAPAPAESPPAPPAADAPLALPTPQAAAAQVEGAPPPPDATAVEKDPHARPYFIKGELTGGDAVRPLGKRSFIGAGAGVAALPSSAGTALNSFFLTIEPQVDQRFPEKHDLKLGFGVPLHFELFDTRAAFESCVPTARDARAQAAAANLPPAQQQQAVDAATADCVSKQQDHATENLGKLRKRDWDEVSDFAKIVRYITAGGEEQPFYLNVSRLYGQSVGHGTVVRRYNPNLDFDTTRVGITFDGYRKYVGVESMVNDVLDPDVFGILGFVRPFEDSEVTALHALSFGVQATVGRHVPRTLAYEEGLWKPTAGTPIPRLDADSKLDVVADDTVTFLGFDVETKLWRTRSADLKIYFDAQKMQDHGSGYTLGSLWRFSFGEPGWMALRVRAEAYVDDADYLPSFFDGFYDVQKLQYLPAGYTSGMSTYYPTKLGFLAAMEGGPRRLGGYLEVTHSIIDWLTVGFSARGSTEMGDPVDASFDGPRFQDASACPIAADGELGCPASVKVDGAGYSSAMVFAQIPFKRILQGFVSYEVFSTSLPGEGLDFMSFDGDNEVLFSGVRLQLLPILFIQGEARRFYFTQRLSNVDVDQQVIEQDQNLRADWTFAINLYAGMEF
jgi:hypothetical protein